MRVKGFTLLELVLVFGIVGVLALLAVGTFRVYITRADAAQTLVNVDQITTVVRVENRLDNPDLDSGATAGAAPPKLQGTLSDQVFQGRAGIALQMIKAPAGTFVSYPSRSTYALVVTAPAAASADLAALRWGLSRDDLDLPWLNATSFLFPIEPTALDTASAATPSDPSPANPPLCSASKGNANGKNWCWCRNPDGSKVKQAC